MRKCIIAVIFLALLSLCVSAGAAGIIGPITETETGITFSLTSPISGDIYVIGAEYEEGVLTKTALERISAADGETFEVRLSGLSYGAKIFVWNSELVPLCGAFIAEGPSDDPEGDGIIHLKGTEIDATGVDGAEINGTILTITTPGNYIIEGTLYDGQIVVSDKLGKKDEVNIELRSVNVTCSNSAPFNGGGGKIGLTLGEGTTNIFTDSGKYKNYTTSKEPKGCVYSRRDLDIGGSGTLVVNANVKNGLVCAADLKIKKGANLDVTAVNNAVKGDNGVEFTGKTGTVRIVSGGDGIRSDAIDTDVLDTGAIEPDKGYVIIDGGSFTINADGDGIQADNYVTITGGNININSGTVGIKASEVNLPALTDDVVSEDTLINGSIAISGGTLNITSGEDGIKAAELIEISGKADITVTAVGTDAADNSGYDGIQVGKTEETVSGNTITSEVIVSGTIRITGGSVRINGASDDGIVAKGNFIMTDGTLTGKADCDFIKAYELVQISGGSITAVSGQDGIQSGKALTEVTSGSTTTKSNYTTGNISISGGEINITAGGGSSVKLGNNAESCKGIKANTELNISGGKITVNSADDSLHSNLNVTITGGDMVLSSGDDGVHADYILTLGTEGGSDDDFNLEITTSYEGIEGSVIYILSGTQYIYSTDDGINAAGYYTEGGVSTMAGPGGPGGPGQGGPGGNPGGGSGDMGPGFGGDDSAPYGMLYIKGGRCYVEAYGDGVDSNGSIEMSGGIVLVNGPTSGGNGVFDIGDSQGCYFNVTGGTLIGAGTDDMLVTPTLPDQGYAASKGSWGTSLSGGNAGAVIVIPTDSGNIYFVPKTSWKYVYATTPNMTKGKSYTLTTTSTYSGEKVFGKTVGGVFYGLMK